MATLREQVVDFVTGGKLSQLVKESSSLQGNLTQLAGERAALREELGQIANNEELLVERMAELELALEDANWMRLMAEGEREFSREGLRTIAGLARMMFLKNPLISRGVMVQALYVWAQGISVRVKDTQINQVLQDFWDDPDNQAELTGHQARMYKEIDLQVEGNLFFVFFTNPSSGVVKVRTILPDEVGEIISNPEDKKSPWLYLRQWTEERLNLNTGRTATTQRKAYYPDWRYNPTTKPAKIGRIEVQWDSPVYHVKTGGLGSWKFGLSEVYAAIDWARAYKEFLEDVASLMRSYARFAWNLKFKGATKKGIAAAKAKLNSTLGDSGTAGETNPPPTTGAAFIGSADYDMQPMNLRGASISPEDGRRFLLMVAAAIGIPETFFGDVSVGTLATGKTLDRPTELKMRNRQMLWMDILRTIFSYVLMQAVKATSGPLAGLGQVKETNNKGNIELKLVWNEGVKGTLDIDFPPVLERDVQAAVQAIVTAATLNGQELAIFDEEIVARLLLTALAQDDVDEIMADLYPDTSAGISDEASTAMMKKAVGKLVEALGASSKDGWLNVVKATPSKSVSWESQ